MRCQRVDDDVQCRFDATRGVLVVGGDPPDPDQAGFAGTIYTVQVCKQQDPDPSRSMPLPRSPTSTPIGNVRDVSAATRWLVEEQQPVVPQGSRMYLEARAL